VLRGQFSSDEPTPVELLRSDAGSARCLLVIGDGFVSTHALPARGDLILGRAAEADIAIDVSCISRRHALLRIGASIQIEDLGSANGTFVDDRRLARGVVASDGPDDIEDALARAGANQTRAAKLLGSSRRTLIARLDEHGLPRPRKDPR